MNALCQRSSQHSFILIHTIARLPSPTSEKIGCVVFLIWIMESKVILISAMISGPGTLETNVVK